MKYIVFFLISFSFSSFAASFDCSKASTQHEKMICSDQKLNDADAKMGSAYIKALSVDKEYIKQNQKEFNEYYKKCDSTESCFLILMLRESALNNHYKLFNDIKLDSIEDDFKDNAPLLKKSCDVIKDINKSIKNKNKTTLLNYIRMDKEFDSGPRLADLKDKSLNEVFTKQFFDYSFTQLCVYPSPGTAIDGYKQGFHLSYGVLDFDLKLYELYEFNKEKLNINIEPIWTFNNISIKPQCFTDIWSSGDNYEAFYDYQFNDGKESKNYYENVKFNDLVQNPGKYLSSLKPIDSPWDADEKLAIAVPINDCNNDHVTALGMINSSINEKREYELHSMIHDDKFFTLKTDGEWVGYKRLFKIEKQICQSLANENLGECFDSYIIKQVRSIGRMTTIENNIYGIFKQNNQYYITPLKRLGNDNDVQNYIDAIRL